MAARIGGILSPLILLMVSLWLARAYRTLLHYSNSCTMQPASHAMVILSVLGLVAGFLTLTLPETLDQPLPEALADVEQRTITA